MTFSISFLLFLTSQHRACGERGIRRNSTHSWVVISLTSKIDVLGVINYPFQLWDASADYMETIQLGATLKLP